MTSQQVYQGIRGFISNHDHKFKNVYVYDWECDSFSVTSSGYVYEIEVKVSRSDFMADFKKPKHHFFKTMKNGYSILAGDVSWINEREGNNYIRREFQHIKPMMVGYENCPNRFFFACPVGLVEVHEVPKYAGLLYVMDSGEIRVIKKAPLLHKEPINPGKMLFSKYLYGYLNQKDEIRQLQESLKRAKYKIEAVDDTRTEKTFNPVI